MRYFLALLLLNLAAGAHAAFTIEDDGAALTVLENGQPVMVYRYALVNPPGKIPERYRRAAYLHPLYGLDGEVLTQDFPGDHFHHRGVFWAWPKSTLGERPIDVWALDGVRQVHQSWVTKKAGEDKAEIAAQNGWVYDDAPNDPKVRETVRFTAWPAKDGARAIDCAIRVENVSAEVLTIRGATDTDKKAAVTKGYGGFCLRPDATRRPMHFTCISGKVEEDCLELPTPWVDLSFAKEAGGEALSGLALFEHPANPGYPHPGWILRSYGFLGQSWPHTEPYVMKPGAAFELRHRLYIHQGDAEEAKVAEAFSAYAAANRD